jgi:hypothetical protein
MGNYAKQVSRSLDILREEEGDPDGSSREVSPKAKCTRSLSHKVDQRDEKLGSGGQDIWQKKAAE